MDHLIPARRPDLELISKKKKKNNKKKKTCDLVDFIVDESLDLPRELKKTVENENNSDIICTSWCTKNGPDLILTIQTNV